MIKSSMYQLYWMKGAMNKVGRIKDIAILFLGVAVFLSGCAGKANPKIYAIVDGEEITREEYRNYENYLLFSKPDLEFSREEQKEILQDLINLRIYGKEAERLGFKGDPEVAQKELADFRKYRLNEEYFGGSLSMYYSRLVELELSEDWILQFLLEYNAINAMVMAEREKAQTPTDEDVEEYYAERKDTTFTSDERRQVSHILLNEDNFSEEEDNVEVKIKELADDLYSRLQKGEDFSTLAKEYSQDTSGISGGSLGFIEKKDVVESFGDSAFSLKIGEVSQPVQSQFGWHIILVTDIEPAGQKELDEELREEIFETLLVEAQAAVVDNLLRNLEEAAEIVLYFK